MTKDEALKKMYQLLLTEPHAETVCFKLEAIAREALAQPVQEPVAWEQFHEHMAGSFYTHPPQRTWVGLTDEEIADCAEKMEASDPTDSFWREFFRGIEAKLKEKNT